MFLANSTEIIAMREFNLLYIILDSVFLLFFSAILLIKKRYSTLLFALAGGVLYMIVDYGIFHLALHTRSITGGSMFWVLLWMSMSYGMTNFALIWIWLRKDEHFVAYTAAVWIWWICCPLLSSMGGEPTIHIQRTTGAYHGAMAIIMVVSYFALIVYNLLQKDKDKRFRIAWLFTLGVLVQLGWEVGLLIGGIRSADLDVYNKIMTLVVNSLVETNLGLPALYCIYLLISARRREDLGKPERKLGFTEALKANNAERYRKIVGTAQ